MSDVTDRLRACADAGDRRTLPIAPPDYPVHTLREAADRIDALETAARDALAPLGECSLDHHGYCQQHWLENPCSVGALRAVLDG